MNAKILPSSLVSSVAVLLALGSFGCAKRFGDDCVPKTCQELGANCGQAMDGCGTPIDCGPVACADPTQTCGAGGPNVCGVGTCAPGDCVSMLVDCGTAADGCGNLIQCDSVCDGVANGPDGGSVPIPGAGGGANSGAGGGLNGTGGDGAGTGGSGSGTGGTTSGGTTCEYGETTPASPTQLTSRSPNQFTTDRYRTVSVTRAGTPYYLITNGWGPGFQSHNIGWNETSISATLQGSRGSSGEPAGYPSVFCGKYSVNEVANCGLPASVNTSILTGMRWTKNGNTNNYNVAWDIWIGNGSQLQSYIMVWLHFPDGVATGNDRNEAPAGKRVAVCQTVEGVPGAWDIYAGRVSTPLCNNCPIINYVRPRGFDLMELEFDVRDFYVDATTRPAPNADWVSLVGNQINSVAAGIELWNSTNGTGPIRIDDFYVDVQ